MVKPILTTVKSVLNNMKSVLTSVKYVLKTVKYVLMSMKYVLSLIEICFDFGKNVRIFQTSDGLFYLSHGYSLEVHLWK